MRLYRWLGLGGFTLCLLDTYTGGRWGELVRQQHHEYDREQRAIAIRQPLKEIGGRVFKGGQLIGDTPDQGEHTASPPRRLKAKKGHTKTPAGTRWVDLPPSIAVFYEALLDSHQYPFVLCTAEGKPWRRSNFRQRHWRPAWDGTHPETLAQTITSRRSCPGSPSTKAGTPTPPGSPRTASPRSPA